MDVLQGADSINRFLHFPKTPISPFNRIGGRRQHLFVQEHQCLFHVGRKQLIQSRIDLAKSLDLFPKSGQFLQSSAHFTSTIKQTVNLVHDFPELSKNRKPPGDLFQSFPLRHAQVPLNQQIPVFKKIGHLFFNPLLFSTGGLFSSVITCPASCYFRNGCCKLPANLCQSFKDAFADFLYHVKTADLMRNSGKVDLQRFGIKRGSISGNTLQKQRFAAKSISKSSKKFGDVSMPGGMIQNFKHQTMKSSIVDNRKNTERSIVNLINSNVSGKPVKGVIQIGSANDGRAFFFPPLQPSFERFPGEPTRNDPARGASLSHRREDHPQRPDGWPCEQFWWNIGNTARRGH